MNTLGLGGTKISSSIVDDLISTVQPIVEKRPQVTDPSVLQPLEVLLLLAAVQQGYLKLVDKGLSITSVTMAKMSGQATGCPIIIPDITFMLGPPCLHIFCTSNITPSHWTYTLDVVHYIWGGANQMFVYFLHNPNYLKTTT